MTVFYDSRKRKARLWTFVVLACVPIFVLILGWIVTRKIVEKKALETKKEEQRDIFKEL